MTPWIDEKFIPPETEPATGEDVWPLERETVPEPADVPWSVQEFIFEELAPEKLETLHDLIGEHWDLILTMARERFTAGFHSYGSRAFNWSRDERLDETLQELADAVVYLCTGPVE